MTLSEKLRKLRTDAGLSQSQLADALLVSRAAVAKWENGNGTPDIENLKALAAYFRCDVDLLLDDTRELAGPPEEKAKPELPRSYCGKDCGECASAQDGTCPGCLDGPGGRTYGKCEIATCCRKNCHFTCKQCTRSSHCWTLDKREEMPAILRRRDEQLRGKMELRRSQATFLRTYIWVLFWLQIPLYLFDIISLFVDTGAALLGNIAAYACAGCMALHGLILLRMTRTGERFKIAGWCNLARAVLQIPPLLLGSSDWADGIKILLLLSNICLVVYTLYHEYSAFSALTENFDPELSERWNILRNLSVLGLLGYLCGLLLANVFALIGALILLAAGVVLIVSHVLMFMCRWRTAKVISKYA